MTNRHVLSIAATVVFVVLAFGSADPPPPQSGSNGGPTGAGDVASPDSPRAEPPKAGKWRVQTNVDPMTDAKIVVAVLEGDGPPALLSGNPTLTVRCMDNETDVLYDFHDGLTSEWNGSELVGTGQFRYDQQEPKEVSLSNSKGISTTYFSRKPLSDAKDFMAHKTLLVGYVAALGGKTEYVTYDLTGATEALQPIRDACGW